MDVSCLLYLYIVYVVEYAPILYCTYMNPFQCLSAVLCLLLLKRSSDSIIISSSDYIL